MQPAASEGQPLTVIFGVDNAFALPLAATLDSLLTGLSPQERPHFYILSQDITRSNRARLERVVAGRARLHWPALAQLPIDPDLLATSESISLASYYRVFLLEMLPSSCVRVIYLDADVIVRGDLRALWEHDMQGHTLMAVRDEGVFTFNSPRCIRAYAMFGIAPDAPYFNAGVLLIDVVRWRQERMTERFLTHSKDYGKYSLLHDQDSLNVLFQGRWGQLDARWNVQALVADSLVTMPMSADQERYVKALRQRLDGLEADAFIMHYNYRRKPWHPGCRHPYRSLFHDHFRRSGCFRAGLSYRAWYAWRYLAWAYKKLSSHRFWKRMWRRTRRKVLPV